MGWLDDVLAAAQRDDAQKERLRLGGTPAFPFAAGGDPMADAGSGVNPGLPFSIGGDPMVGTGNPGPWGGALPPNLPPSMTYPVAARDQGPLVDIMGGIAGPPVAPPSPFPDMPPAPATVPQMTAQAPLPGVGGSPIGGGGAPFSMGGGPSIPPSVQLASAMAGPPAGAPQGGPPGVPPQMAPQPPVPALGAPFTPPPVVSPPVVPGAPVVARDDGPDTPTDASAARRGVPAGPAVAAPMSMAGPGALPGAAVAEPSIMERISAGAKGISPALLGVGAALSGDQGHMTMALAAQRDAKELQAQGANATGNALLKAGAPAELVAAAIRNPEMLKAAVGQYLGKDKFKVVQTGENDRGKKTFQLMNEQDGTFKKIPGAEVAADSATEAAAAAGVTGAPFLDTVPNAQDKSLIKQLTNYDLDPAKLSAKGGNRERLLALAEQYDPDYKAVLYAPRAAALKEFTSGGPNSPASIITNGNTAIQHLGRMSELADKLGGTNKAWVLNGMVNWANITMEDMKNNPDLARYKGAEDRFVEEATKFYRGVGGNKADIDRALGILKPSQSPEARQQAIQEQAELMQSKVNALQDRFKSAVGPSGWKKAMDLAGTEFPIVQKHSADELEKIRKRAAGEKVAPAAPVTSGTVSIGGASIPWSVH